MSTVLTRPAQLSDCTEILSVHRAAIRVLCFGDYSETQLAGWAERLTREGYHPAIQKNVFIVAERAGHVIGFGELAVKRGEIVAIYVHPDHARQGVGTRIFRVLERVPDENGVRTLRLDSSLSAVSFYERLGFVSGDVSVHRLGNGTEIPCVGMSRGSTS